MQRGDSGAANKLLPLGFLTFSLPVSANLLDAWLVIALPQKPSSIHAFWLTTISQMAR